EVLHVDAARRARMALRTMREIQMAAGATKAAFQRRAVQLVQLRRGRIEHQVLRSALGVVAAGVGQGLEQAYGFRTAHGTILCRQTTTVPACATEPQNTCR